METPRAGSRPSLIDVSELSAEIHAVGVTHDRDRAIRTYHWTDEPRGLLCLQNTDGHKDWRLYRADLEGPELFSGSRFVG